MSRPPQAVEMVLCAVMVVLENPPTFTQAKKVMSDPEFIKNIKNYNPEKISNKTLNAIEKYTKMDGFDPDTVSKSSKAASALCCWVRSMEDYAKAYRTV